MLYPVDFVSLGNDVRELTVTGNHIEGAVRVIHVRLECPRGTTYTPLLSGNNFVGTTELVFRAEDSYSPPDHTVNADLSGSYWGVATQGEIDALIDMSRAAGTVDTSGFSPTPLVLDVPQ